MTTNSTDADNEREHDDPTHEEIATQCAAIQRTWSPGVERSRRGLGRGRESLGIVPSRYLCRRMPKGLPGLI